MEEETKISFFKRVLISIKDFDKYKIFALEKLGKSIKYVFQLSLILMIFIALSFTIKYGMLINKGLNYIKEDLPDFTYENGNLNFNIEEPLVLESGDSSKETSYKIIIDTNEIPQEKIDEYKEKTNLYNYGIVFLRDKVIINSSLATQTIEQKYSDIQSKYSVASYFNKQDMISFLNSNNVRYIYIEIFIFLYIYLFASYFLTILMDAILLAVLGIITARIVRVQIKFSGSYAMALHALTLPIILNVIYIIVNAFTGFYIKYFDVMYTTVSYIYMVAAILSIRTDLIKQQIEIGKIKREENNDNSENSGDEEPNLPKDEGKDEKGTDENGDSKENNKNEDKNKNGDIGDDIPASTIEINNLEERM